MRPSRPTFSKAWVQRQLSDPFVKKRNSYAENYRARSAFKLLELDEQYSAFLTAPHVHSVVDLGAAPGGWSQVVAKKLGWSDRSLTPRKMFRYGMKERPGSWSSPLDDEHDYEGDDIDHEGQSDNIPRQLKGRGTVVAVDLLHMEPIAGVQTLKADFLAPQTGALIHELLRSKRNPEGRADAILSDIGVNQSGNNVRDTECSLEICHAVFSFVQNHLRTAESIGKPKGGVLVLKHFMHPLLQDFRRDHLVPNFYQVHYVKPKSSRSESKEGYWVCLGWKPR